MIKYRFIVLALFPGNDEITMKKLNLNYGCVRKSARGELIRKLSLRRKRKNAAGGNGNSV